MLKSLIDQLTKEISGDIAKEYVSEICNCHRIQGSPGLLSAIQYVVQTLEGLGLNAQVRKYPADGETYYWSSLMFREWRCWDAELWLIEPEEKTQPLARWLGSKFSLIQRSYPTPIEGIEAEVVILDKGEDDSDYTSINVKGKMVLTDGDLNRVYEMAVERRGALGIIFSGMRTFPPIRREGDLDDALQYTSFWWSGHERSCFGFVLSPRKGRWLRTLIKEQMKYGKKVRVRARVDAKLLKGSIENAVVVIPGKTEEEVIIVAHICHPQPSANDNASGCGAAMEVARALHKLIFYGMLPKPLRTIRFTFVPEMTGTYAWLAENEKQIPNMVAALNLDMVGENQDLCGGPLIVEKTPASTPSFVNSLIEAVFDEVKSDVNNLGGSARYALFKHVVTPFSGGSDHYIYSDPTVNVPCPMIIQWPDKFYHTNFDTIEKVDPEMLRKVSIMAATYAYYIANANLKEAIWLVEEVATRHKANLTKKVQKEITFALEVARDAKRSKKLASIISNLNEKIEYEVNLGSKAIRSVSRLVSDKDNINDLLERAVGEFKKTADLEKRRAERAITNYLAVIGKELPKNHEKRLSTIEKKAAAIVPKRLFRGPIPIRQWAQRLSMKEKDALWKLNQEHKESRVLGILALYWINGDRDLLEISKLVGLETNQRDLEYLIEYFTLLEKMRVIEFKTEEHTR